jgi:hypothetical protein
MLMFQHRFNKYFIYLCDYSISLYLDIIMTTPTITQFILMNSKTPTCFELIAHLQEVLHTMSYVLMVSNTHVGS